MTDAGSEDGDPISGHPPVEGPERRIERLRQAAIAAEYDTGRREESEDEARDSVHVRLARMALGFILLIAGVAMLALPGPGIVTIGFGLVILARDFAWAERLLDRIKDRLPQDDDGDLDPKVIVLSVVTFVGAIAAGIWWYLIR